MRPSSLPFGFPPFRYALQLRKKLAKAQTFSFEILQSVTNSGGVSRGFKFLTFGFFN
jgi:hypothetical protein